MKNKKLIVFIIAFFIIGLSFLNNSCFAADLEVQYPTLTTGETITTTDTPLPNYLKYLFNLGMSIGFLAIFGTLVYAGVLYLLSPVFPNAIGEARDRVSGAITGFIILFTLYLIMTTINPYLAIFKLGGLEPVIITTNNTNPGVFFYESNDCSGPSTANTSDIRDLGKLKNKTNSISIVHNPATSLYYISVLFDEINNWGKCMYVNPNSACSGKSDFVIEPDSATIKKFRYTKYGDRYNVNLYRSPFGNGQEGYTAIRGSEIESRGIYIEKLENIKFYDPYANLWGSDTDRCTSQTLDCKNYNEKGVCYEKQCPNLGGENLGSIAFNANYYLVLLVYFDPITDAKYGPWTYCQAFSTIKDVNREGVIKVDWENIRQLNKIPNYLIILPIEP